jgi:hypothetical protein
MNSLMIQRIKRCGKINNNINFIQILLKYFRLFISKFKFVIIFHFIFIFINFLH